MGRWIDTDAGRDLAARAPSVARGAIAASYRAVGASEGGVARRAGRIEVRVARPLELAISVDSTVRDLPGGGVVELLSTYVGSSSRPEWRAVHLEIDPGAGVDGGAHNARVRTYRPTGATAEPRLCVLDHLMELQDVISGVLGECVAVDLTRSHRPEHPAGR